MISTSFKLTVDSSDPFAIVSFNRYSTKSRVVKESVCPMWNQTLIIEHIRLFGDPDTVEQNPPPVILELFDKDQVVSNSHLFCE